MKRDLVFTCKKLGWVATLIQYLGKIRGCLDFPVPFILLLVQIRVEVAADQKSEQMEVSRETRRRLGRIPQATTFSLASIARRALHK